jgi:glycopeptide antibiotics resistance protein
MQTPDRKPLALGYALLTYMTLVIAAITMIPFDFKVPGRIHINLHGSISDILANIVLFLPLGFIFQLARPSPGWRPLLQAAGFGLLVSTTMEACQLFLPGRDTSLIDVVTNGLGALLGAASAAYHQRRSLRQKQTSGLFAFEMPLTNVVYLLIPLLWLGSIMASTSCCYPLGRRDCRFRNGPTASPINSLRKCNVSFSPPGLSR